MYTSATDRLQRKCAKTAFAYLIVSLFCALFGAVYEVFSHGVYSFYMIYAFGFPLAGGALPFLLLSFSGTPKYPPGLSRNLYHSGIATLTVGSLVRGVLDIYGTTNALSNGYWIVGIPLVAAGAAGYGISRLLAKKEEISQ